MPKGAVITADIVNSTLLPSRQEKKLLLRLGALLKDHKFEFYRGDSFQAYIKNPQLALQIGLQARAIARSFSSLHDVRASIGIGSMHSQVHSLRTSTSEAFVLSGRAFDELAGEDRLMIQSPDKDANAVFRILAYYCDHLFKQLTSKQAAVINELLMGQTQIESAKRLHITQATLNKHAKSASWYEIERLLKEYQQIMIQFNLA